MARIKIALPEHLPFVTELMIYIEHINEGQHLDNARLLGLVAVSFGRRSSAMVILLWGFTMANRTGGR